MNTFNEAPDYKDQVRELETLTTNAVTTTPGAVAALRGANEGRAVLPAKREGRTLPGGATTVSSSASVISATTKNQYAGGFGGSHYKDQVRQGGVVQVSQHQGHDTENQRGQKAHHAALPSLRQHAVAAPAPAPAPTYACSRSNGPYYKDQVRAAGRVVPPAATNGAIRHTGNSQEQTEAQGYAVVRYEAPVLESNSLRQQQKSRQQCHQSPPPRQQVPHISAPPNSNRQEEPHTPQALSAVVVTGEEMNDDRGTIVWATQAADPVIDETVLRARNQKLRYCYVGVVGVLVIALSAAIAVPQLISRGTAVVQPSHSYVPSKSTSTNTAPDVSDTETPGPTYFPTQPPSVAPIAQPSFRAFNSTHELKRAVDIYIMVKRNPEKSSAALTYGYPIGSWDVSRITDFSSIFSYGLGIDYTVSQKFGAFNEDLSGWNVSQATNMTRMFSQASAFNGNLSNWDVSKVRDMRGLFSHARAFNGNISNWNVSQVSDMEYMFHYARAFNGDISNWNVNQVNDMDFMFYYATAFNGDISNWDVSRVKHMSSMFRDARAFNGDIADWNVSRVNHMDRMFTNARAFNEDLSGWDVSQAANMTRMFSGAYAFNGNLSNWDVSKVTGMGGLFDSASAFNGDISNWDVSRVNHMEKMFYHAKAFNGDISNWDVSQVTQMDSMFWHAEAFNGDISNWDVSRVTQTDGMFLRAYAFNGDISNWNVSQVVHMRSMFSTARAFDQNLCAWRTRLPVNCDVDRMFAGVPSCLGSDTPTLPNGDSMCHICA